MPTQPPKFFAPLIITLGIISLVFFYLFTRLSAPPLSPSTEEKTNESSNQIFTEPTISLADPSLGPAQAKVTIVEFADYRCPHCSLVNLELKKILQTYPNHVRLVWKDFPFLPPLDVTWQAHEAARCAEKQKKFWEFHDVIYANQDNLQKDQILNIAKTLNLNITQFSQCLDSEETKPLIIKSSEEGKTLGVDGAPFFFVNGKKWIGEMTVEKIGAIIATLPI